MKYVLFLTIFLCLSNAYVFLNLDDNTNENYSFENVSPYNIHIWITQLQLQTCAIVAIGLKYFAIFVEHITETSNTTIKSTKYFIGICHESILEKWDFCSKGLAQKRKHKCRFKLRENEYHPRVHRRFCDFKVMAGNIDCSCKKTLADEVMYKVRGFPACYIAPLPHSLCKYNVCGLSRCQGLTIENRLHTAGCDPNCTAGNPFCEGPVHRTSRPPEIHSQWSKWSRELHNETGGESQLNTMKTKGKKHRSVATCINKYTGKPDLDCLGPGTSCCSKLMNNCQCNTFEEEGGLKVERIIHLPTKDNTGESFKNHQFLHKKKSRRAIHRYLRDANIDTENDLSDDEDEDNDDLGEDIVLEENTEIVIKNTEVIDKEDMYDEYAKSIEKETNNISKNNTLYNCISCNSGSFLQESKSLVILTGITIKYILIYF